jgi:uncharacterized coiled-coil DUF342 family protein
MISLKEVKRLIKRWTREAELMEIQDKMDWLGVRSDEFRKGAKQVSAGVDDCQNAIMQIVREQPEIAMEWTAFKDAAVQVGNAMEGVREATAKMQKVLIGMFDKIEADKKGDKENGEAKAKEQSSKEKSSKEKIN